MDLQIFYVRPTAICARWRDLYAILQYLLFEWIFNLVIFITDSQWIIIDKHQRRLRKHTPRKTRPILGCCELISLEYLIRRWYQISSLAACIAILIEILHQMLNPIHFCVLRAYEHGVFNTRRRRRGFYEHAFTAPYRLRKANCCVCTDSNAPTKRNKRTQEARSKPACITF